MIRLYLQNIGGHCWKLFFLLTFEEEILASVQLPNFSGEVGFSCLLELLSKTEKSSPFLLLTIDTASDRSWITEFIFEANYSSYLSEKSLISFAGFPVGQECREVPPGDRAN